MSPFYGFSIGAITRAGHGKFLGEVQIEFGKTVDPSEPRAGISWVIVKTMVELSETATLSEIETALLLRTSELLRSAATLTSENTVSSLAARMVEADEARAAERREDFARALDPRQHLP